MFVVIARYVVAPENQERVRQLLVPLAAASREEPGNRGYEVLNDLGRCWRIVSSPPTRQFPAPDDVARMHD
jgi:quinol monooxygenase YgiN